MIRDIQQERKVLKTTAQEDLNLFNFFALIFNSRWLLLHGQGSLNQTWACLIRGMKLEKRNILCRSWQLESKPDKAIAR